jgi:hypothetical protein
MTHMKFTEQLVMGLTVLSHEGNTKICGVSRGWSSTLETRMSRTDVKHSLHQRKTQTQSYVPNEGKKNKNKSTTIKRGHAVE